MSDDRLILAATPRTPQLVKGHAGGWPPPPQLLMFVHRCDQIAVVVDEDTPCTCHRPGCDDDSTVYRLDPDYVEYVMLRTAYSNEPPPGIPGGRVAIYRPGPDLSTTAAEPEVRGE